MQSITPRVVPAIIEFAFGDLAREPHRVGKPLERELTGLFGARRGPYRLLYRIDDEALRVYIVHIDTERTYTALAGRPASVLCSLCWPLGAPSWEEIARTLPAVRACGSRSIRSS